jgi:hypothetical protein
MDPIAVTAPAPEADFAAVDFADFARVPTWALLMLLAFAVGIAWMVGFENGQLSRALDHTGTFFHEFFHDGRHLIGAPCH